MIDTIQSAGNTAAIRALNDQLRRTGTGGRTVLSRGLAALPTDDLALALRSVAGFNAFTTANDPFAEHDCGIIEAAGNQVMWKIDYYSADRDRHSDDPADPSVTSRVLTIMLAEEY